MGQGADRSMTGGRGDIYGSSGRHYSGSDQYENRYADRQGGMQSSMMRSRGGYGMGAGSGAYDSTGALLRDNTLPLALIGAGIGWMLLNTAQHTEAYERLRYRAGQRTGRLTHRMRDSYSHAGERVREGYQGVRERLTHAMDSVRDGAERLRSRVGGGGQEHEDPSAAYYDRIADYDARQDYATYGGGYDDDYDSGSDWGRGYGRIADRSRGMMRGMGSRASMANQSFWDLVEEHPLAAGLMSLALGAALGATLPSTQVEDEWLGDYGDQIRHQAMDQGRDTLSRTTNVAREAALAGAEAARERAREEAERQGLTVDELTGSTSGTGSGAASR